MIKFIKNNKLLFIILISILLVCYFNSDKEKIERIEKIDINDILKNNYYINLEHRKDRNQEAIMEIQKIGITNPNRFNAIKHDKG